MSGKMRLSADKAGAFGRLIDRTKPVSFRFDGQLMKGYAGDTLASALLANDVTTISRSFKYHRPRGIMSIGADDPCAFVSVGTGARHTPNSAATQILIESGLTARSQNAWPSLNFDLGALAGRLRPLMPPGFQYKTFKRPLKAWRFYEKALRKMGGLGQAPVSADPDRYEHVHAHADILIVGGGIAGIAAAEAAAAQGLKVFLAEASPRLGGIADAYDGRLDGVPVLDWVRSKVAALAEAGNVHLLTRAQVAGLYDHGLALIAESLPTLEGPEAEHAPRERLWHLRSRAVVLATGAYEKPLVFPNNDRPGIMLATSARLFLRRYAVAPGTRIAIATTSDEGYRTAMDLEQAGVEIARIVDLRLSPDGATFHITKARGMPISPASAPVDSMGKAKAGRINSLTIANRLTLDAPALLNEIACDALLVSGGWAPNAALAGHLGAQLPYDAELGSFRPGDLPSGLFVAGAANAQFDLRSTVEDGWRAGAQAATHITGTSSKAFSFQSVETTTDEDDEVVGALPDISTPAAKQNAFVDFHTDTTVSDMEIAVREGYGAPELMKRYTGSGLGPDQGKSSFANTATILPKLTGSARDEAQHTTFRPPWTPITLGALAGTRTGKLFRPLRQTPITSLLKDAIVEPLSGWMLPTVFALKDETRENAVRREVRAARNDIGIFDASAAGCIAIKGEDAYTFLDRMSATELSGLNIGTARQALFLNEEGHILEDAMIACQAVNSFIVSTGIGRGAALAAWFERWHQTRWPELDLAIVDETERLARIVLCGARVPELLEHVPGDIDISQFSTESFAQGDVCGVPARALSSRYTASPEVEISVAAGYGPALWSFLLDKGKALGLTRFGVETAKRMRLEAGLFDLGREMDGHVTPHEVGLGALVAADKHFTGRAGLERSGMNDTSSRHFVGILMDDRALVPPPGTHLLVDPDAAAPRPVMGYITASAYSPTLRRSLALARVNSENDPVGTQTFVTMAGDHHGAAITTTDFLAMAEDME